ncbi:twin-arginine translocase subunit TatC [Oceanispirochaeta crateris]|uniref:Sec-independent protein translocase protein TatC n=1 Tax=Oceanispirochaeta crateris TaxID=2518645 RepID=A0A5C1QHP7_9SPIO|nr:twin-arginine translocase subunit TatC [Oceanispirochaeta crateris]QEN06629.1 twin-arginine translocase subunit TatC [Oceanispirochaeta crateris]
MKHKAKENEPEVLESQPVLAHIKELRTVFFVSIIALAIGSCISFYFFDPIINFLYKPFSTMEGLGSTDTLFVNFLFEGFVTKLKISVMAGLTMAVPVILFMLVRFTLPALRKKEKNVLFGALVCGGFLVIVGFYYGYFYILPLTVQFFTSRGFLPDNVGFMLNYQKNVIYIFRFILMIMLSFQFPILLEVLLVLNIVSRKALFKASRFVIVLVFIVSALITPPDFISQCIISLPLIFLYFCAIFIAKIFHFGEQEK